MPKYFTSHVIILFFIRLFDVHGDDDKFISVCCGATFHAMVFFDTRVTGSILRHVDPLLENASVNKPATIAKPTIE
jgi:hypothetical protein